jgi:hypothetical protein
MVSDDGGGGGGDLLVDAGVVLLLDDTAEEAEGHYCEQSLTAGDAGERAELVVSFPADETRIGADPRQNNRQPAKRGLIAVSDAVEARRIAAEDPDFTDPVVTDAVVDRTDLSALGTKISRFCEVWENAGHDVTLCFDSLTDLLAANEPKQVFQFAHVLSKRLAAVDAVAHFHLDPDAHPEQVVGTFEDLFDEQFIEIVPDAAGLDLPDTSGTASDTEVAESAAALDGGDAASTEETETGGSTGEASDEDIADALGDAF